MIKHIVSRLLPHASISCTLATSLQPDQWSFNCIVSELLCVAFFKTACSLDAECSTRTSAEAHLRQLVKP